MDLFSSPSAGFDDPLEILDACHARVRRFSALAVRIAERMQAGHVDDDVRRARASVIRYFDEAGPNHHLDEEQDLFPLIEAIAPPLVERLKQEHRDLEALWARVRAQLLAQTLSVDLARSFMDAYSRHIELEEAQLLPLARRSLDPGSVAKLGRAMAVRRGVKP